MTRRSAPLHYGRKRKRKSFTSCRGRVNISCGSENSVNIGALLPFVPSKVQKASAGLRDSAKFPS